MQRDTVPSYASVLALYEQARFVDAYLATYSLWSNPQHALYLDTPQTILAARLAGRLGSVKIATSLFRLAQQRNPAHAMVRYYCRGTRRATSLFDHLALFVANPELETDDADLRASWFASHASYFATVRDFSSASHWIERAHQFGAQSGWVDACHAGILLRQDRREEALERAETAWNRQPGMPYTAGSLADCLSELNRAEEGVARLRAWVDANGQSFDVLLTLLRQILNCAERASAADRLASAKDCFTLAQRFEHMAPLADRFAQRALSYQLLEAARLACDYARVREMAPKVASPFYNSVAANLERNPSGIRVLLPHKPVRQDYNTCLPASVCTVLSSLGKNFDQREVARQLTFEGTPSWRVSEWAAQNGLKLRHFFANRATVETLISLGVPFILGMESLNSAHATAVVGADSAMGTILIHDPSFPGLGEMLIEGLGKGEAPLGPRCAVIYPIERAAELDALVLNDESAATAMQEFFRIREQQSAAQALDFVQNARLGAVPAGEYMRAMALSGKGHAGESLEKLKRMFAHWPDCVVLQRSVIAGTSGMGNTALLRDALHKIVTRAPLPGTSGGSDYIFPAAHLIARFAGILRRSATSLSEAKRLAHKALRRGPMEAEAYSVLGDIHWQEGQFEHALLPYRLAACLHYESDYCARSYADTLHKLGREREAIDWLLKRALDNDQKLDASGTWRVLVETLEDFGYPKEALERLAQGLALRPSDGILAAFAALVYSRFGKDQEADKALEVARRHAPRGDYHNAACAMERGRGRLEAALQHARLRVENEPFPVHARGLLAHLIEQLHGPEESAKLCRQWMLEHPDDEAYEDLLLEHMGQTSMRDERKSLLQARLARNPDDAWACREMAFLLLESASRTSQTGRLSVLRDVEQAVLRCEQTCPDHEASRVIRGDHEMLLGHKERAFAAFSHALDVQPAYGYAVDRLFEVAGLLGGEYSQRAAAIVDAALARTPGQWSQAPQIADKLGQALGVNEARERIAHWLRRSRRDPYPVCAWAELLLDHGRGVSDARRIVRRLSRAIGRFPLHVNLRYSLAHAYSTLGRSDQEVSTLQGIVETAPRETRARVYLAEALEPLNRFDEAEAQLRKASELDPLDHRVWLGLCEFLVRRGKDASAIEALKHGNSLIPGVMNLWNRRCELLSAIGRADESLAVAREVASRYPDGALAQLILARALRQTVVRARRHEIEAQYELALKLNAQFFDTVEEYTSFLTDHALYERARQVIEKHLPLVEDSVPLRAKYAEILRAERRPKDALDEVIMIVRDRPEYSWGWHLLMEWCIADKREAEGRELLAQVHPALEKHTAFQADRLDFLAKAGAPRTEIEKAWQEVLQNFPQSSDLNLRRFKELLEADRLDEATQVINDYARFSASYAPTLAAQVQLACKQKQGDKALEHAQRLWFDAQAENYDVCFQAAEALAQAGLATYNMRQVCAKIKDGHLPSALAAHALGSKAGKAKHFAELLSLVEALEPRALEYGSWELFSSLLDHLISCDKAGWVLAWKRRNEQVCREDTRLWMVVGRAMHAKQDYSGAAAWYSDWQKRPGVELWGLSNYVDALLNARRYAEAALCASQALTEVEHDHSAPNVAEVLVVGRLLSGDLSPAMAEFENWREVLDRAETLTGTRKALDLFSEMLNETRGDRLMALDLRFRTLAKSEFLEQSLMTQHVWTRQLRKKLSWPRWIWHVLTTTNIS